MKPSSLLPATTAALAAAQGGFFSACSKTWTLGYRGSSHFVVDACPSSSAPDVSVTSALDLNDCLGNREGVIEAMQLGHAFDTCRSCTGAADGPLLTCECWTTDEVVKTSTFDLGTLPDFPLPPPLSEISISLTEDTVVSNNDGVLGCFDLPGFEVGASEL
ncbi:Cyanovirin-N [Xylariaceae sp. FL0662B]|nr:Cyanovirin-N [Xylariaceae sp. FL0662B]